MFNRKCFTNQIPDAIIQIHQPPPTKKRMPKISNYSPLHIPLNKMEKGLVWDLQHSKFGIRLFWTRD